MTTVTIDIIDEKGMNLLKDLEALNIIRLHNGNPDINKVNFFKKYKGKMTKQPIEEVERQLKELRDEWD